MASNRTVNMVVAFGSDCATAISATCRVHCRGLPVTIRPMALEMSIIIFSNSYLRNLHGHFRDKFKIFCNTDGIYMPMSNTKIVQPRS